MKTIIQVVFVNTKLCKRFWPLMIFKNEQFINNDPKNYNNKQSEIAGLIHTK